MKNWTAALVVASFLMVPTLARADGGVEIGALGGAMAGSLMGTGSDRVEHAVIGAVVGALLGAAIDAEEQSRNNAQSITTATWSEPGYVATYPTTRYVIAEPVHYREGHRWDRHRHHHRLADRHSNHHRWDRYDHYRHDHRHNWD
ncbi:MAG: glycine zipper domain-containing protein [Magnetococcus sp. YQC-5]